MQLWTFEGGGASAMAIGAAVRPLLVVITS